MRQIINFNEVQEIIGEERMDKVVKCFYGGFEDCAKMLDFANSLGSPADYQKRSKASIIHEQIRARLSFEFQGVGGIEVNEWNGIFGLNFNNEFLCRVKKFSKGAVVSVIKTDQQKDFQKQLMIDGFPDQPTFITMGYFVNKAWTELLGVYFSCWSADGLEWFHKVGGAGFQQLTIQYPKPVIVEPATRRAKGKKKDQQKGTGTEGL
jgi:hypothetical protein